MNCRQCEDLFVEALYGELEPEARRRFDTHLESCAGCAQTYVRMQSTLDVMERREQPDPGHAYWDGFWNRLSARMEREEEGRRRRGWLGRLFPSLPDATVRWAYRGVVAALLIVFGAVAGRVMIPGTETGPESGAGGEPRIAVIESGGGGDAVQTAAEACARQYIEDSQVLLLALVRFDPGTEGEYLSDWSAEKKRSRELVSQAGSLKDNLNDPGQRRLRELVKELELIMMQIANIESAADSESVELIRSSVNDRDVMLKINLEKLRGGDSPAADPGSCDA